MKNKLELMAEISILQIFENDTNKRIEEVELMIKVLPNELYGRDYILGLLNKELESLKENADGYKSKLLKLRGDDTHE